MIVEKPDKSLRLCIDPKPLNKYICREHYSIPTSNDITSQLTGKCIFSVIDMKDGFWQLQLDDESADLCTFNSPFGRYRFNRVPFGISSAPELFQRKSYEIFGDIPGVEIYFDDLIIGGVDEKSHDIALKEVLDRARINNVKFNWKKFQFKLTEVTFLGQIISAEGIKPDSHNVRAILELESPQNKTEVLRVLGLLKFFSKFIPNLSQLTTNLRELTKKYVQFKWEDRHELELNTLKALITKSPTLRIFDPKLPITIQCDASSEGLGCCLLQQGHPVAFASRCLTNTEKRWAQIEKELLAIVFACEKFHYFIYGYNVTVHSDHKPLIPIFSKDLDKVTARLQRMLLRLLKYKINIIYLPGKDMVIADILSRSSIKDSVQDDSEMEYVVHALYNNIPMSLEKKAIFKKEIESDPVLSQVKSFCQTSWPVSYKNLTKDLKLYYKLKDFIYLSNDLIFLENKVIVPAKLRKEMLNLIHESHFGVEKSKRRARQVLYWPNLSRDIEDYISKCQVCQLNRKSNQKESLINRELPSRVWQYLFSDFFEYNGKNFLLIVDAYSNWIEVTSTKTKTADDVINFCKNKFMQFGVPDKFYSDNVPYNSNKFKTFAKEWDFELVFSSPHHHQSNGLAERYVGIVKDMLKKSKSNNDLTVPLMEYHTTPIPKMGYSPSQLFLHRILKTKLPTSEKSLQPVVIDPIEIQNLLQDRQLTQKKYYDKTAKDLPKLNKGDNILIQKGKTWEKGKIKDVVNDRSYVVKNSSGNIYRRNRKYVNKSHLPEDSYELAYDFHLDFDGNIDNREPGTSSSVPDTDYSSAISAETNMDIPRKSRRLRKRPTYLKYYQCGSTTDSD